MSDSLAQRRSVALVGGWRRLFTAAAAAMVAAVVTSLAYTLLREPTSPSDLPDERALWGALALSSGLVLALLQRWGWQAAAAAAAGVGAGLSIQAVPADVCVVAALACAAGAAAAMPLLSRFRFDPRLERPQDPALLGIAVAVCLALPVASLVQPWASDAEGSVGWGLAWATLTLGGLAAAVATLAVDRSLLLALQRGPSRARTVMSAAALCIWVGWLALASRADTAWAALPLFALPALMTALALNGQLALASCGLIAAGLLGAQAPLLGNGAVFGAWFASALATLLIAHGAQVRWRGRSQRWEWALDGSRLGVADWHLRDGESFASAAWRTLTAHDARDWSPAVWQAQVHADDRGALAQAIDSLSSGSAGRAEVELRMPQGEGWRWAEATLLVIERDAAGHPQRLLATLADVHDRREALERQRMSASLFQHLHEGLLITDPDLRALDVNPAYTQILGVPREELLGTVPSLLRPAPDDPVARQQRAAMWTSLRDTGSWRGELIEHRRDGQTCVLQATISTVHGPVQGEEAGLRYHVLVISDITEQQAQRDQLERQAHFDELTRLPNRARLSQLMGDAMGAADRDGYLLVVCYLDLDRFKPVNDRYGHAAGDRLLAELAGRLRGALRSREHWTDCAARLGGDEFVLLLRAGTLEEARLAVERVLRVVALPYLIDPAHEPVQVTASMGATVYPVDRSDADTLLRHADHAMYGAKQSGRNGYLFFDPEQRRRTEQRVMAIGRIQEALDQQEFVLYYQPKVDMKTSRVLGFEALLRWEHPEQGLVAPLQFLPLIENTGLSSRVGDWVLSRALEHLSNWRRKGFDFSVSVNVSARHLQEADFAQRLAELLARHEDPLAGFLEIEMLETAAHADIEATSALLARCQGTGVRFALDDFGTGYSTLTYLKRLPVDVLKIDRSFVHHMLDDKQDRAIVEGVIGLARTFGCTVVAEGVESPAQARTLMELGCDIGQGTGIAAPMPAAQVAEWVRDYKGMFALTSAAALEGGVARLGS